MTKRYGYPHHEKNRKLERGRQQRANIRRHYGSVLRGGRVRGRGRPMKLGPMALFWLIFGVIIWTAVNQ